MPRTPTDIFSKYPNVEVIEVVGYKDGGPFGLSSDGHKLKILDDNFARHLARLPDSNTEAGHITEEGYYIHGDYVITEDRYEAFVCRLAPYKNI